MISSKLFNLLWPKIVWWCVIMSQSVLQKDCLAVIKVIVWLSSGIFGCVAQYHNCKHCHCFHLCRFHLALCADRELVWTKTYSRWQWASLDLWPGCHGGGGVRHGGRCGRQSWPSDKAAPAVRQILRNKKKNNHGLKDNSRKQKARTDIVLINNCVRVRRVLLDVHHYDFLLSLSITCKRQHFYFARL